ncbi:molecular chaperone Hsp70 [Sphingomonas sp. Leaf412]|uniref:Hsp70 family protein n=1 Tax=Sphingomonas sp. Leaf412 TaxID=1736370 RepID=UPI0006FB1CC6|nr:Hsp70 family protein [Sphingomonas sp. Leaf412]KQT32694.1 molecular chaperone Hsp70 [Sphingomonas sp. Leaf412]
MTDASPPNVIGLDFGTTNTVAARATGDTDVALVPLMSPDGQDPVFRSALCFWEEAQGVASAAGPWAVEEYLAFPQGCRFIQSFKSVAATASFNHATIFGRRWSFEELGARFLRHLRTAAQGAFDPAPARLIVGRPVEYAGHRPDPALARARYDAMFAGAATSIHYVYEPLAAAYSYATRLAEPATVLVADFGGGTSDFSVVRIAAPGAARRCVPIGHAGVGIAGDRFDRRIIDHLLLPLLGLGGTYRSFDKVLDIPRGYFGDVADWSRLALMRNPRTLAELERLRRSASDPDAIARMIAIVEEEQGYALYDAVGKLKRQLSVADKGVFRFEGGGVDIEVEVERAAFEAWIAPDLARIEAAVERALDTAQIAAGAIDRVFLTGGTSLTPSIRQLFVRRFGAEVIATGEELTSIAHGLALVGREPDLAQWEA